MEPLTIWTCDACQDPISDPSMSLVVWRQPAGDKAADFMIVHKGECTPEDQSGFDCHLELDNFLGPDGAALLLSWLSAGPIHGTANDLPEIGNLDQYVDLFRRVQAPFYEEARPRFKDEDVQRLLSDANHYYPYLPQTLKQIMNRTLGRG